MLNQNSWYGQWLLWALSANTAWKTFIVADSTNTNINFLNDFFTPDEGVQRRHATITSALAACTAWNGDVILVAPGHTETVATASALTVSISWVTIKWLWQWALRPNITINGVIGASVLISWANVTIENVVFTAGLDAITAMINVTWAYFSLLNSEVVTNTAALWAVLWILTAATATGLKVEECRFLGTAANTGTTTTAQIKHEVWVDYVIRNNYFTCPISVCND